MKRSTEFLALAILAFLGWWWLSRQATATLGPLNQVGDIGNTSSSPDTPALDCLCRRAPLNSFGPDCYGITWGLDGTELPYDFRTAVTTTDCTPTS